jgi:type II secretory pathway component PulF
MTINQRPAADTAYVAAPVEGQPARPRRSSSEPPAAIRKARWYQRIFLGRVQTQHLVNFCRQFASYLDAGINLYRAMESLRRQYERTALGPVIGRLQLAVRRGESLTDAMSREPAAFDYYFLSMMRVAEVRGSVPETLRMLAVQYDARLRMIRQTKSALIYPAFVIFVSVTVSALLTILVLPPLVNIMQDVIAQQKVDLPLPTRLLIGVSDFIVAGGWWAIPLVLIGTVVLLVGAYRLERGKAVLDEVLMRLPVVGLLLQKIDTTRFCRTLSTLLDAGVDIGSSLELTADTLLLVPMRRAVLRARDSVTQGESLSASIDLSNRFPPDIVALMNSGEETGRLPEMLMMVADQYEEQVEFIVKNLGTLLQPLITIVVGGVVFFIAVAFFMGYASVISTLGQKNPVG